MGRTDHWMEGRLGLSPKEALDIIKSQYTDAYGHICQQPGYDKGDTANREGVVAALVKWNGLEDWSSRFDQVLNQLEKQPGAFIRHGFARPPQDQDYCYLPTGFSRDQQTPIEIAMGEYPNQLVRLYRLYDAHRARYYKYQNKDWGTGTYSRSLFNRAGIDASLNDISLLINVSLAFYRRFMDRYTKDRDTSNDVNLALLVIQAHKKGHSPISWLASRLYWKSNPMSALENYFGPTNYYGVMTQLAPPIHWLYVNPLKEACGQV